MRILRAALVIAAVFPLGALAQASDSVPLGERVRVRVPATRGNANLFIGTVMALSPDTLTLAIPGGKGTVILPRASISELAVSNGRHSRWRTLPLVAPLLYSAALVATARPLPGPSSGRLSSQRYALLAADGLLIGFYLSRTPPERWRRVYSWLDRP